jgi:hypothetical protein
MGAGFAFSTIRESITTPSFHVFSDPTGLFINPSESYTKRSSLSAALRWLTIRTQAKSAESPEVLDKFG